MPRFRLPTLAPAAALLMAAAAYAPGHRPRGAQAAALDDPTIVAIFDEANTADIETGALAERMGASQAVRAVGKRFKEDHTGVRQQGRDLAKKLKVTPTPPKPDTYAADHAKAMTLLKSKKGPEFDRAFLDHEIAYHQAVIDALTKTLLPAIKNAELKALVEKVAPAFQSHLALAQATKQQLKL